MNQFSEENDDGHRQTDTQADGGSVESPDNGAGADSAPAAGEGAGKGTGAGGVALTGMVAATLTSSSGWAVQIPMGTVITGMQWSGNGPVVMFGPPPMSIVPEPKLEVMPPEVGEIVAWRAWKVNVTKDGYRLKSVTQDAIWEPNEPMEGRPFDNGLEGVYSSKTRDAIAMSCYGIYSLVGEVAIWGDVVEHENGYRSQFARVLSLELNGGIMVVSESGVDKPEGDDALRVLNFVRAVYGLPFDVIPTQIDRVQRSIVKFIVRTLFFVAEIIALFSLLVKYG